WEGGKTVIRREGKHKKFVPKLEQVCYSAKIGRAKQQTTYFVTERAVFKVGAEGLELIEIAPGLDAERDVIAHMGFRPRVATDLRVMDGGIFEPAKMGLAADVAKRPLRYRSERLRRWSEGRQSSAR